MLEFNRGVYTFVEKYNKSKTSGSRVVFVNEDKDI